MKIFAIASLALVCLGSVQGYGSGAPTDACKDMVPQHHTPAQSTPFPYSLTITPPKKVVRAGEKVTIKIAPADKSVTSFQGFLVQARVGDVPVGKFIATNDVKTITCGKGREDTATHVHPKDKPELTIQWTAPPNLSESVTFYATVAENGGKFWVKQPTQTLVIKG